MNLGECVFLFKPSENAKLANSPGLNVQTYLSQFTQIEAAARRASSRLVVAIVLTICSLSLLAGLVLKLCPVSETRRVSLLCYSDLKTFFEYRGIRQMPFPYLQGGMQGHRLLPGSIEYPVLTGIFAWVTAQAAWSSRSYLAISAPFLGALGLLVSYLLARMAGWRALLWAAAPALVLYAFHNWDLLAVAPTVAGLWCWWHGRPAWAAVWFGVGTATKLYPAIFVGPLMLEAWFLSNRRAAAGRLAVGAGTTLLINLPFMLVNPSGWYATYAFHKLRPPNIDSIWGVKFSWSFAATSWPVEQLNLLTTFLILSSFLVIFVLGWQRAHRDGTYPVIQVCGALLAAFLLWNKVHSPQYVLWLLPFFVLLRVSLLWWAAYAIVDGLVYLTVFYLGRISLDLASPYLQGSVYGRAALLLALIVAFLRAEGSIRQCSGLAGQIPPSSTPLDRRSET